MVKQGMEELNIFLGFLILSAIEFLRNLREECVEVISGNGIDSEDLGLKKMTVT